MKFSGVKKISAAAIAAMMLVAGMTACGSSDSTGTADSGATTGTDVKKIGIIQLVEHDSLDLAREGFIDGLAEAGYVDGQNIKIDYRLLSLGISRDTNACTSNVLVLFIKTNIRMDRDNSWFSYYFN